MCNRSSALWLACIFLSIVVIATSCDTNSPPGLFGKKNLHDQYANKIKNAGLNETALGRQWFAAAEESLASPLSVNLPYSETGYFAAEEPKAAGITFRAKRGEKLTITLTKRPTTGYLIFMDLWENAPTANSKPTLLRSADTTSQRLEYEVDDDQNFILRLQPELLKGGEYTVSISTGPTLAFPVTPKVKSTIASFWGAGRDAGARKHEGIDIFAPRGTLLVAAADGIVTRVQENKLGGKVVFLRPNNKNYTLYYAHLQKQIAEPGQRVRVGDSIGLVGNTGNAITTDPHLHFGIYTYTGAIDPLPFINRVIKTPDKITAPLNKLAKWVRTTRAIRISATNSFNQDEELTVEANTALKVQAASANRYKVSTPGGETVFVPGADVELSASPLRKMSLKATQPLLDQPHSLAARKTILAEGKPVSILATYKDFYLVNSGKLEGWICRVCL